MNSQGTNHEFRSSLHISTCCFQLRFIINFNLGNASPIWQRATFVQSCKTAKGDSSYSCRHVWQLGVGFSLQLDLMTLGSSYRVMTLQSQAPVRYTLLGRSPPAANHIYRAISIPSAAPIGSDDIVFRIRAENPRGRTLSVRPYGKT